MTAAFLLPEGLRTVLPAYGRESPFEVPEALRAAMTTAHTPPPSAAEPAVVLLIGERDREAQDR
ncbi:hypothetical protein GCM10010214_61140 [Streptomyces abikoensis]|nr:hypothetical protein GCM10010214_61140 [Streptomyces abikoensis]